MVDATTEPELFNEYIPVHPSKFAWLVLLAAVSVFCLVCAASTYGLQYFFVQSAVPMQSVLRAGRGTISVREGNDTDQALTSERSLSNQTMIRTDPTQTTAQATITLIDPTFDGRVVGVVTLRGGTQLQFAEATRPRFEWSTPIYYLELDQFVGELDIRLTDDLQRDATIRIRTADGQEVWLENSGHYIVTANPAQTSVTNYDGEALLIGADREMTSSIPIGHQGTLDLVNGSIIREPILTNLVKNSELMTFDEEAGSNLAGRISDWQCTHFPVENTPLGDFYAAETEDRWEVVRFVREGASSQGDVRCEQRYGDTQTGLGIDLSEYNYMEIKATVRIGYQSLSRCGQAASECPIMFEIGYQNVEDGIVHVQRWNHGVFARDDGTFNYRLRCDTCQDDHIQVHEKSWVIYESGNLFDLLPQDAGSAYQLDRLTALQFYASGHDYDVYIDDISLLVGNIPEDTVGG